MNTNEIILFYVKKYLDVPELSKAETKNVLYLYSCINPETFKGQKLSKVGPILGKVLGDKIKLLKKNNKTEDINIKDYQIAALGTAEQSGNMSNNTRDGGFTLDDTTTATNNPTNVAIRSIPNIKIDKFLGINDLAEFKMLFNPDSMLVHYYLVLDSNYRDTSVEIPTDIKKFKWNYTPTQNTVENGFCNSVGVIRDVIGMRMYQPRIPYLAAMDTDAKRVSVLIEEFAPQAFITETGRRFHFILRPEFTSATTSIELSTEDYNDGIFNFRKPITKIDTMTISFGDPLNILTFATPFDRFMMAFEFVCYKSDK